MKTAEDITLPSSSVFIKKFLFGHTTKIIECADNSFKLFTEIVRCERITDDVSISGLQSYQFY